MLGKIIKLKNIIKFVIINILRIFVGILFSCIVKRNENLFKQLIENIDIKNIEKISKVDLLQNNIFLSKIYSFIYCLIDYFF